MVTRFSQLIIRLEKLKAEIFISRISVAQTTGVLQQPFRRTRRTVRKIIQIYMLVAQRLFSNRTEQIPLERPAIQAATKSCGCRHLRVELGRHRQRLQEPADKSCWLVNIRKQMAMPLWRAELQLTQTRRQAHPHSLLAVGPYTLISAPCRFKGLY